MKPCDGCLKIPLENDEPFKRCAPCKMAFYCSRECQVKDWKNGHKKWCRDFCGREKPNMKLSKTLSSEVKSAFDRLIVDNPMGEIRLVLMSVLANLTHESHDDPILVLQLEKQSSEVLVVEVHDDYAAYMAADGRTAPTSDLELQNWPKSDFFRLEIKKGILCCSFFFKKASSKRQFPYILECGSDANKEKVYVFDLNKCSATLRD